MGFIDNISAELARLRRENDALRADLASIRSVYDFAALEAKIAELRTLVNDAGHYVACCPPPSGVTGELRISLLEERSRIARAASTNIYDATRALEQKVVEK